MSCKINAGVLGVQDCTPKTGGVKRILIASKASIDTFTTTACPEALVSTITMLTDPEDVFYEFQPRDRQTGMEEIEAYDVETDSTTYTYTLLSQMIADDATTMCALRSLFQKPVVVLLQENGQAGRWKVYGLEGGETRGLMLTEIRSNTGVALTETTDKLPRVTITGVLDTPSYYLDADGNNGAGGTLTDALIVTLTTP